MSPPSVDSGSDLAQLPYEQLIERLEMTVTQLESGGLSMDEAIATYEQGIALSAQAQRLLDAAEQRIRELREADEE
ncbi:MAG TPA: exodeoxyribonuclease VII small subunit [Dehalococcoidia bacterium]|nr:exodeoxyribonuclease VII small subunit [Dehalococcoidia bacterium]